MAGNAVTGRKSSVWRQPGRLLRPALFGAGLFALLLLGRLGGGYLERFVTYVDGLGFWGPTVFIGGYALATVAFVPGLVLTLAAGAIFDLWRGALYVFVGAVLGSTAAFLIARYVARDWVDHRVRSNPRFGPVDRAIESRGRRIVLLLRLSPVFPFNLLNYALGLTRVRLIDYLVASIGMIPGTFMYVYFGKAAGSVAAAAGGRTVPGWTLWIGLVVTVVAVVLVTRTARRELREATRDGVDPEARVAAEVGS